MAETRISKQQARLAERQRRRAERERRERLTWMIPVGILGAVVLFIVGLGLFGALKSSGVIDSPNGKAKFTVDTEKLELGDQKLGRPINASFKVTNAGDGRLTLNTPPMVTALEGC